MNSIYGHNLLSTAPQSSGSPFIKRMPCQFPFSVVPVMIALAVAAGVNPIPPAIGATFGASWGFMLPVSTPPNAIVYGSGMVPITKMIRAGIGYDIVGGFAIWIGLRIILPLVGLA